MKRYWLAVPLLIAGSVYAYAKTTNKHKKNQYSLDNFPGTLKDPNRIPHLDKLANIL